MVSVLKDFSFPAVVRCGDACSFDPSHLSALMNSRLYSKYWNKVEKD